MHHSLKGLLGLQTQLNAEHIMHILLWFGYNKMQVVFDQYIRGANYPLYFYCTENEVFSHVSSTMLYIFIPKSILLTPDISKSYQLVLKGGTT